MTTQESTEVRKNIESESTITNTQTIDTKKIPDNTFAADNTTVSKPAPRVGLNSGNFSTSTLKQGETGIINTYYKGIKKDFEENPTELSFYNIGIQTMRPFYALSNVVWHGIQWGMQKDNWTNVDNSAVLRKDKPIAGIGVLSMFLPAAPKGTGIGLKAENLVVNTLEQAPQKDLALGLGDDLFTFAESKNLQTYRDFSTGFQPDKILEAMENSKQIHFNVTGFSKIKYSKFTPGPIENLTYHNYTNWEMNTIQNTPTLLNKTIFYSKPAGSSTYNILNNYTPHF